MTNALSTLRSVSASAEVSLVHTCITPMKNGNIPLITNNLTYDYGACWFNCMLNKDYYYASKDKRLRLAFGSVSVDGFDLYGNRHWTDGDWEREVKAGHGDMNAHCWLQDEEGNIYDKYYAEYEVAKYCETGKKGRKTKINEVFEGISRRDLMLTRGLAYNEMPRECAELFCFRVLGNSVIHTLGMEYFKTNEELVEAETMRLLSFDD